MPCAEWQSAQTGARGSPFCTSPPWRPPTYCRLMPSWHSPHVSASDRRCTLLADSLLVAMSCAPWHETQLGATVRPLRKSAPAVDAVLELREDVAAGRRRRPGWRPARGTRRRSPPGSGDSVRDCGILGRQDVVGAVTGRTRRAPRVLARGDRACRGRSSRRRLASWQAVHSCGRQLLGVRQLRLREVDVAVDALQLELPVHRRRRTSSASTNTDVPASRLASASPWHIRQSSLLGAGGVDWARRECGNEQKQKGERRRPPFPSACASMASPSVRYFLGSSCMRRARRGRPRAALG